MKVTALTGSGISAASGIKTYRAEGSGWDDYAQGIAHAKRYGNHLPELWRHWTDMARAIDFAKPNTAHVALAQVQADIITQNVDGLHQEAGSENVIELHGDMRTMRCLRCKKTMPCDLSTYSPVCSFCGSQRVRSNCVLFGENLLRRHYDAAVKLVDAADLVVVVGTSGSVQPASYLVERAIKKGRWSGRKTVLFDIAPWSTQLDFSEVVLGPSHETLPDYFSKIGL